LILKHWNAPLKLVNPGLKIEKQEYSSAKRKRDTLQNLEYMTNAMPAPSDAISLGADDLDANSMTQMPRS
jgi:hypothetical protein